MQTLCKDVAFVQRYALFAGRLTYTAAAGRCFTDRSPANGRLASGVCARGCGRLSDVDVLEGGPGISYRVAGIAVHHSGNGSAKCSEHVVLPSGLVPVWCAGGGSAVLCRRLSHPK